MCCISHTYSYNWGNYFTEVIAVWPPIKSSRGLCGILSVTAHSSLIYMRTAQHNTTTCRFLTILPAFGRTCNQWSFPPQLLSPFSSRTFTSVTPSLCLSSYKLPWSPPCRHVQGTFSDLQKDNAGSVSITRVDENNDVRCNVSFCTQSTIRYEEKLYFLYLKLVGHRAHKTV